MVYSFSFILLLPISFSFITKVICSAIFNTTFYPTSFPPKLSLPRLAFGAFDDEVLFSIKLKSNFANKKEIVVGKL